MRIASLVALAAVALVACIPSPQPPTPDADASPPPDTPDAAPELDAHRKSPCDLACANLVTLGCPEGKSTCAATCEKANGTVTDLHTSCLVNARTKADARKCGSVSCP
jgi:hypothetical protein